MSRQLCELEPLLQQMIVEHLKLLAHIDKHEAAMKAFDLRAIDEATRLQEGSRLRIAALEQRRRAVASQLCKPGSAAGELTLRKLAALQPERSAALLQIGGELRNLVEQIAAKTHVTRKLASTVLGHLNTVVRLVAGAVEKAGLYTKNGTPKVSGRIGMMEAVG